MDSEFKEVNYGSGKIKICTKIDFNLFEENIRLTEDTIDLEKITEVLKKAEINE